ncbi:type II 3-dehydroquinate dehydratase [Candidatus Kaiserbacteria bacterium RIFCSPLOWO2_01_FULL_54_24]|uniref:3-dehydroquinate dehydratase n=1 Tax=Candidatus Kaiserbacteria bacterium RIFCSPLOWO2_01_FULL_54_24 TaxID=1798515 RepID=A0A1F6EUR1_9BACT|nr:MAG: type II 3-dehydroquinate dehydratase [Candidatus Kaiserbacteria bacterium RIFCSPLOWO2_01_FULL_54_24]
MSTILLIHGPNLNMLGERDKEHYGSLTLSDIETLVSSEAKKVGFEVGSFQSNHEGALIDFLQKESPNATGVIINPGALTHYSYALHDALVDTGIPAVEVHLSDINAREEWRRHSVTAPACIGVISGKKEKGYVEALALLISNLKPRT